MFLSPKHHIASNWQGPLDQKFSVQMTLSRILEEHIDQNYNPCSLANE